jgi:hypothetical protein
MTLLISNAQGFIDDTKRNLSRIVSNDIGLTYIPFLGGAPNLTQVVYFQTVSGFGQNRINSLVNSVTNTIIITGLDNLSQLPGNIDLISIAGGTTPANPAVIGPFSIIDTYYDASNCGGNEYFVFDQLGNVIDFPIWAIIYHELAHAYHLAIRDFNTVNPEFQAITDENQLRSQLGFPLRDPNNHVGGCYDLLIKQNLIDPNVDN